MNNDTISNLLKWQIFLSVKPFGTNFIIIHRNYRSIRIWNFAAISARKYISRSFNSRSSDHAAIIKNGICSSLFYFLVSVIVKVIVLEEFNAWRLLERYKTFIIFIFLFICMDIHIYIIWDSAMKVSQLPIRKKGTYREKSFR